MTQIKSYLIAASLKSRKNNLQPEFCFKLKPRFVKRAAFKNDFSVPENSVWPDRAIFESSWRQFFLQNGLNICCHFGLLWKHSFLSKSCFLATFGKIWATFYSNIWSRCPRSTVIVAKKLSTFIKFACSNYIGSLT